jgi:hypothetical protein
MTSEFKGCCSRSHRVRSRKASRSERCTIVQSSLGVDTHRSRNAGFHGEFSFVTGTDQEGRQRVGSTRSVDRPAMTAICAFRAITKPEINLPSPATSHIFSKLRSASLIPVRCCCFRVRYSSIFLCPVVQDTRTHTQTSVIGPWPNLAFSYMQDHLPKFLLPCPPTPRADRLLGPGW